MIQIHFVKYAVRLDKVYHFRCARCKHLLGKMYNVKDGEVEIKCSRCKSINRLKFNNSSLES